MQGVRRLACGGDGQVAAAAGVPVRTAGHSAAADRVRGRQRKGLAARAVAEAALTKDTHTDTHTGRQWRLQQTPLSLLSPAVPAHTLSEKHTCPHSTAVLWRHLQ